MNGGRERNRERERGGEVGRKGWERGGVGRKAVGER